MNQKMTAIIEREGDGYVALCPDVDVVSQGDTIDEARNNLKEALELFFETASPEELTSRLHCERMQKSTPDVLRPTVDGQRTTKAWLRR